MSHDSGKEQRINEQPADQYGDYVLHDDYATLASQLAQAQQTIEILRAEGHKAVGALTEQLAQAQREAQSHRDAILAVRELLARDIQNGELETEALVRIMNQRDALERDAAVLRNTESRVQKEHGELLAERDSINEQLAQAQQDNKGLRGAVKHYRDKRDALRIDRDALKQQFAKAQWQFESAREAREDAFSYARDMEAAQKLQDTELAALRAERDELSRRHLELANDHHRLRAALESIRDNNVLTDLRGIARATLDTAKKP